MVTVEELTKLLGRQATPRMVEIWNGVGIPEAQAEGFRQSWLRQARVQQALAKGPDVSQPVPLPKKPCGCGAKNPTPG
jgi:methylmalonyl-CoA mutase N-terminal domain/subunit